MGESDDDAVDAFADHNGAQLHRPAEHRHISEVCITLERIAVDKADNIHRVLGMRP